MAVPEPAAECREVGASAGRVFADLTLGETESQVSPTPEPTPLVHPTVREVVGRGAYTPVAWSDRRDEGRAAFQLDDGAEEAGWSRVRNTVEMVDRFFTYTREAFAEMAPVL